MPTATISHSLAAGNGLAKPAVSALTGASNAQPPQSQKDVTMEPQPKVSTRAPGPDSCCEQLQPPVVCHNQPSSGHSGCNGEQGQSQDGTAGEQLCRCKAESAAQANGGTGEARDTDQDRQPEKQPFCKQPTPADMTSGVDVTVEDASLTSPCNCRVLQQASIAALPLQPPQSSAGGTIISDETPQEAMQQQQGEPVSATEGPRRGILGRALLAGEVLVSGLTGRASGAAAGCTEQAQRAQRRRLADKAVLPGEPERSTADSPPSRRKADSSFMRQNSSELDGSQGAAWGLATMLKVRDCRDKFLWR